MHVEGVAAGVVDGLDEGLADVLGVEVDVLLDVVFVLLLVGASRRLLRSCVVLVALPEPADADPVGLDELLPAGDVELDEVGVGVGLFVQVTGCAGVITPRKFKIAA